MGVAVVELGTTNYKSESINVYHLDCSLEFLGTKKCGVH